MHGNPHRILLSGDGPTTSSPWTCYVRLFMPIEVTPEVLVELKRDRSRRELISHVTGNPAAKFNDPVVFTAQWQPVTLSRKTIDLKPAECELLDQMSANDFGGLGPRVVRRDYSCDPNRVSHFSPRLDVDAFLVRCQTSAMLKRSPVAGDDKADPSVPPASDEKPTEPAELATDKTQE